MTDATTADAAANPVEQAPERAGAAAPLLAAATTEQKNAALLAMADALTERGAEVEAANQADIAAARTAGLPPALVNRLGFAAAKIAGRIRSLRKIAALPDPVGQPVSCERRPNGLLVSRVRAPLGVILMIYEARPHVTVNAGAFCLKSGNAAILRGGSEARRCNALLGELWAQALATAGLPETGVQVISGSHEAIGELLHRDDAIDLVIPRGGKRLIESVAATSRIPVIKHFAGICHVYLDRAAEVCAGIEVALDSKCLMPEVCNAMETLLVHRALAPELPRIVAAFRDQGVTVRGDKTVQAAAPEATPATDDDWRTEYLDTVVAVRVVDSLEAAIAHINTCGSHHTDAIVTDSLSRARVFTETVDSGVVLVNASTMFCDGESLGMGAEIGISTDKLHARGPMGLNELTTCKFVIQGAGHIMGPRRNVTRERTD